MPVGWDAHAQPLIVDNRLAVDLEPLAPFHILHVEEAVSKVDYALTDRPVHLCEVARGLEHATMR